MVPYNTRDAPAFRIQWGSDGFQHRLWHDEGLGTKKKYPEYVHHSARIILFREYELLQEAHGCLRPDVMQS